MFTPAMLVGLCLSAVAAEPPTVIVDRDDVRITESCRVRVDAGVIEDANGDGVIHITGSDIEVDFTDAGALRGAMTGVLPDAHSGLGVHVTGKNVHVRGLRVSGYKVGIHAIDAPGLVIEDCDVSDNFRQHLKSTPKAEDGADWLWPHDNDDNQWMTNYGAGLCVEDSDGVIIRRVRARDGQNGIILDRVNDSRIYDNDCSFLSGWGLAMWRSSRNVISRNTFDFCIRGYSHGVYNRGQDSAGILMFEQCCDNVIADNSATHGGDGFFGFAGREALGDVNPREDTSWYHRRGNNRNLLIGNDFSYAAAHGIEMTFSFENRFIRNRLAENAICGVWGGYSQDTRIIMNAISGNGEMAYGLERGGVNIEHGMNNRIIENDFSGNKCGVHLWWDNDAALLSGPWAKENRGDSSGNRLIGNRFNGNDLDVHLRQTDNTEISDGDLRVDADEASLRSVTRTDPPKQSAGISPEYQAFGDTRPVGARIDLRGRDKIIMTEWGPYAWDRPLLLPVDSQPGRHEYRIVGIGEDGTSVDATAVGDVSVTSSDSVITISTARTGAIVPYVLHVKAGGEEFEHSAVLANLSWRARAFPCEVDPREDLDGYLRAAEDHGIEAELPSLDLKYASGGPGQLGVPAWKDANLPTDHFGTIAETRLAVPAGRWRLRTTSDDGIRVWVDDELVIDDWTWHPPKELAHEIELGEDREIAIRVEHFELDGYAVLAAEIEAVAAD